MEELDPGYVFINWLATNPTPFAKWQFVPNNVPVATIPNWPHCYRTDTLLSAGVLAGLVKGLFGNIAAFPFFQKLVIREV